MITPPPSGPGSSSKSPGRRLPVIDVARAVALLAMACFHGLWDLGNLRLTPDNYAATPLGRHAAQGIAGSFLVLVGIGLVLMNGRGIRPRPTLRRLLRVAGGALLVTIATRIVFPDAYVFFGVLHCITVASVIGLPFLFLPWPLTLAAAAAVLAAPAFIEANWLDSPLLWFLGLGRITPHTNDYVPLFPWFGLVLAGIVLGRLALPALSRSRLGAWEPHSRPARAAAFAGRHSLAVYLIHQPVLFGLAFALAALIGPNPKAGLKAFRADYFAMCTRGGGDTGPCRVAARCTSEALVREDLFRDDGRPYSVPERARAQALSQGCYTAAEGGAR
ncbi:heparan-alpha-glucosaminide N-acetyltransferase [Methylobacterium persicinum]|uniref:Membrane protein n=1 Tax=Methylobacterium persicinum TaxID=374426 RepID=A0ABU0HIN5_9HYPH|nr:heparan-alpha-glucosaminide N-acetyltransferase [Methylobacterium persicinum]MDQ0441580.1 putative membrane protein [Methylobacterium persicinum]GJE39342.1 hypothetical protein KHHGKMAE_3423 [Methylobacterium persicinum]